MLLRCSELEATEEALEPVVLPFESMFHFPIVVPEVAGVIEPIVIKFVGGWHIEEICPRLSEIDLAHHHFRLVIALIHFVIAALEIENIIGWIEEPVITLWIVRLVPLLVIVVLVIISAVPVVIKAFVIIVGPVIVVGPVRLVELAVVVELLVIVLLVITFWVIPIPMPPLGKGLLVACELIIAVVMPVVRPEVHALVIVGIVVAELPLKFLLVAILVIADTPECANISLNNLEVVVVNMTVLKHIGPVDVPFKVFVHHVLKSEEVVSPFDVAMLPVTVVKVHETRCGEVHVEVVIVGPIEVNPVSLHFFEVEPVKSAPCEVCESTEVKFIELSVPEIASSKVLVVKVATIVVSVECAIVEVSERPLNCTHLSLVEFEVVKSAVVELY